MNRSSCINCSCEGNLTGEKVACQYFMMPADLVKRVVEACRWEEEGKECCS